MTKEKKLTHYRRVAELDKALRDAKYKSSTGQCYMPEWVKAASCAVEVSKCEALEDFVEDLCTEALQGFVQSAQREYIRHMEMFEAVKGWAESVERSYETDRRMSEGIMRMGSSRASVAYRWKVVASHARPVLEVGDLLRTYSNHHDDSYVRGVHRLAVEKKRTFDK